MAPDCESPQCHEKMSRRIDARVKFGDFNELKTCVSKKVPKRTLWIAGWAIFVVILIPLFLTGIRVWSGQESDHLRYAEKSELVVHGKNVTEIQVVVRHMGEDIQEIKQGQEDVKTDIKEILRHLRDKK